MYYSKTQYSKLFTVLLSQTQSRFSYMSFECLCVCCRQALTEVSVLADMLHILHDHRHYMAMDTVAPPPPPSLPLAYQYLLKKKVYYTHISKLTHMSLCSVFWLCVTVCVFQALARAADILKRGTDALTHSSSREERAFHRALAELRRRWRVRRSPTGNIVGDLGYSTGVCVSVNVFLCVHLSCVRSASLTNAEFSLFSLPHSHMHS